MNAVSERRGGELPVRVVAGPVTLDGDLTIPDGARGVVLFAHGSGSSRRSPRNRLVARRLREAGLATLLFDLLTPGEEAVDAFTLGLRFNIDLLAYRLGAATDWLTRQGPVAALPVGYFGASTGAAAALVAAAANLVVRAVVSRGGRPDLAGPALARVQSPTLLIVGGNDQTVLELNRKALAQLGAGEKQLVIVPGAGHLFEEPGTLDAVAGLAADWLSRHLDRSGGPGR